MLPAPPPPPAVPVGLILTRLDQHQMRMELRRRAGLLPVSLPRPLPAGVPKAHVIASVERGR